MRLFTASLALFLAGCGTVQVGGQPTLVCDDDIALISDAIIGTPNSRLTILRRFIDGDKLCRKS